MGKKRVSKGDGGQEPFFKGMVVRNAEEVFGLKLLKASTINSFLF
jgi:hypothetical protein